MEDKEGRCSFVFSPTLHETIIMITIVIGIKGLIALTTEIDYEQTEMGLPPVKSAVFLMAK
jgi:hypothetical protein